MNRLLRSITRSPRLRRRRLITRLSRRLLVNTDGGEMLEYALVAGLIVVGAIGVIGCVGTKVVAKWTSLNSKL